MGDSTNEIALGITDDHIELGSHHIHFRENHRNSSVEFACSSLGSRTNSLMAQISGRRRRKAVNNAET